MHCCGATWILPLQHPAPNKRGTFAKGKDAELTVRYTSLSRSKNKILWRKSVPMNIESTT